MQVYVIEPNNMSSASSGGEDCGLTASDWRAASMQAARGVFRREATAEKDSSMSSCPLCSQALEITFGSVGYRREQHGLMWVCVAPLRYMSIGLSQDQCLYVTHYTNHIAQSA